MTAGADDSGHYAQVDEALRAWRQGDCVLGEHWFVHRTSPMIGLPEATSSGGDLIETQISGYVIVTQTCDLVRSSRDRPFLEISPLVEVDATVLREIQAGRRPGYAFLPLLAERGLAADLDRTMTIDKSVVALQTRVPGWSTDNEIRRFQQALARKRSRFAFPNDFAEFVKPLQERLSEKHSKNSDEGRALRALREIRVQADPSWNAASVKLMFWFIRHDEDTQFEGKDWSELQSVWLNLVHPCGRFAVVNGQVSTLDRLTAAEYVHSDLLDLSHLSDRSPG